MSAAPVRYPLLLLLFPAWLALLFYLPTLAHGYVWDDTYFLRDMPYLRDAALWWQALQEPLFVSQNYFRPLPLLTFVIEARLGSSQAFVFHAVNVLLHMLNTTLVVFLARSILPADRRGLWMASAAGVLFALHPALVENVSWISDRFDLLMAFFILLALWLEIHLQRRGVREILQMLCLLGALLSKETGIVLVPLLLLWQIFLQMDKGADWSAIVRDTKGRWRLWSGLLLALAGYLALRYSALGFLFRGNSALLSGDFVQHLLLIGKTLGTYLVLLVFPFGQISPVHPAVTPIALSDATAWLGLLLIMAITGGLIFQAWRRQALAVLGLMALVALGPVSNMLPLTIGDNIAHDRYLLLTVVFSALALSRWLAHSQIRWLSHIAGAWALLAAGTVVFAVPHWESDDTLWAWAYQQQPESRIAAENYITVLVNTQRDEEALSLAERFVREGNWRQQSTAHYLRAFVFWRQNRLKEAEFEITQALDLPRTDDAHGAYMSSEKLNVLASIQIEQKRYGLAGNNIQASLSLAPSRPRTYNLLALWHYRQGQLEAGDEALAQAYHYALPDYAEIYRRKAEPERQRAARSS